MQLVINNCGYHGITEVSSLDGTSRTLIAESSVIDNYRDSLGPGKEYLWVGNNHLLHKDQVVELVDYLQNWLETGCLATTSCNRCGGTGGIQGPSLGERRKCPRCDGRGHQ